MSTEIVSTGYRIVDSRAGRHPGEYPVITAVTDNAYESELACAFKVVDTNYWKVTPGYIARTAVGADRMFALQAFSAETAREWVQFIAALYVKAVRS